MIDLNKIKHIYIYPGLTDMRLGIFGLRKKILETSELENNKFINLVISKQIITRKVYLANERR